MNEIKDQSFISRFEFSVCCSSVRLLPSSESIPSVQEGAVLRELFWYINFPDRTGVASRFLSCNLEDAFIAPSRTAHRIAAIIQLNRRTICIHRLTIASPSRLDR